MQTVAFAVCAFSVQIQAQAADLKNGGPCYWLPDLWRGGDYANNRFRSIQTPSSGGSPISNRLSDPGSGTGDGAAVVTSKTTFEPPKALKEKLDAAPPVNTASVPFQVTLLKSPSARLPDP